MISSRFVVTLLLCVLGAASNSQSENGKTIIR
jgi:hypothetical protein